ncbi:MAG: GFA family protein [Rhizorhabdus sp.]
MSEHSERSGGCLCGAIRYRLMSEPYDAGYCHCRMCQLTSGAPAIVFATVPRSDFLLEKGELACRRSSDIGERWFCGTCGTPIAMVVDYAPDEVDFTVVTLDDSIDLPPAFHIWRESRVGWFDTIDALPRHERARPRVVARKDSKHPAHAD